MTAQRHRPELGRPAAPRPVPTWIGQRVVALVVGLAVLAGACGGPTEQRGGEAWLPGPLPAGVTIAAEQADAPRAPVFTLRLLDGAEVEVADLWADRPLVIVFLASWCGTCVEELRDLAAIQDRYGDALTVLGVAGRDTPAALTRFLEDREARFAAGLDDDNLRIWTLYAVDEPPLVAVVGKGGRLLRGWPGGVDRAVLEGVLDGLISRS